MKLELEIFGALCSTKIFKINNVRAWVSDFGEHEDVSPETAEDYGCGDMQFLPHSKPAEGVLDKYGIDDTEFREVQRELDGLSFGACGWCI